MEKDIRNYALQYIGMGLPVLPLHSVFNNGDKSYCTCRKPGCSSIGKHPRTKNGVKDASTDIGQIEEWFSSGKNLNIGIATGGKQGLLVIDVDPRNGGEASEEELLRRYPYLKDTLIVETGGGGRHYYLVAPRLQGVAVRSQLDNGIDVKFEGGYVVAPPSCHNSGKHYTFELSCKLSIGSLLEPCENLMDELVKSSKTEKGKQQKGYVYEGGRNNYLTSIAGKLHQTGIDKNILNIVLAAVNKVVCDPPLPEPEVTSIAESISKYPVETKNRLAETLKCTGKPSFSMDDAMFYGLPGNIVKTLAPNTEAQAVGLLLCLLPVYGCLVGRESFFMADGAIHYPNLFGCLVGPSSKGRKGTT